MHPDDITQTYSDSQITRIAIFVLLIAIFFMMQYTPGFMKQVTFDLQDIVKGYEHGNYYRKISLITLGLFGFFSVFRKRAKQHQLTIGGFLGWLVLFYLILGGASVSWAEDTSLTIRRVVSIFFIYIGAFAFIKRFTIKDMVDFIILATSTYILTGLIYEIALGFFVPLNEGYRFAGMVHPNHMGSYCALLLIAIQSKSGETRRHAAFFIIVALIAFIFLIMTKSRTMLVGVTFAVIARWMVDLSISRRMMIALIACLLSCILLLFTGGELFSILWKGILLGRSDSDTFTLTGRTLLWKECLTEYAAHRPILGYGLGGFWGARHVYDISSSQNWSVGIGHSTYVDQLLELGIIGLGTYLLILAESVRRSITCYKKTADHECAFLFALFVFIISVGILETVIPYPSMLSFLIFWAVGYLAFRKNALYA